APGSFRLAATASPTRGSWHIPVGCIAPPRQHSPLGVTSESVRSYRSRRPALRGGIRSGLSRGASRRTFDGPEVHHRQVEQVVFRLPEQDYTTVVEPRFERTPKGGGVLLKDVMSLKLVVHVVDQKVQHAGQLGGRACLRATAPRGVATAMSTS
ncbi:MAG: hypothetical protein BJ554DRAFT_1348, partial [Olpidium bornovanus]